MFSGCLSRKPIAPLCRIRYQRQFEARQPCVMNAAVQLSAEAWAPCSVQAVVLAFLKAEWDKWPLLHMLCDRGLLDRANLEDPVQNSLRASLLWQVRGMLWQHVPSDTEWFEVRHLTGVHFGQLLNIHHLDWSRLTATNTLEEVAQVQPEPLRGVPDEWQPILWAHDQDGPFTILEGNHRLTALAGAAVERQNSRMIAYVGLSGKPCGWHRPDRLW